jgi:uncharacterized protein (UPF0335 family)
MNESEKQLQSIVSRIERIEEEKRELSKDLAQLYAEAKGAGFDVKALRKIIAIRRMKTAERVEMQAVIDTYMHSLGMLADTPLGRAAIASERSKLEAVA